MLLAGIGQTHAYQERVLSLLIAFNSLFSDTITITEYSLSVEMASRAFLHYGGIFFLHKKRLLKASGTGK